MAWKLSTAIKKNVTQVETWVKDDKTMEIRTGWRWGVVTFAEKPEVELDGDEDDYIVADELGDIEDQEFDDGCWIEFEFNEAVDPEMQEKLKDIYGEDGGYGLEEEGWYCDDSQILLYGPLELEEV